MQKNQQNSSSPSIEKLFFTRFMPIIGAAGLDSLTTYFPNAIIVKLQSNNNISLKNAIKQQLKSGIYYGHLDFLKFRLLSRASGFTGLQIMNAYNIKNNFKNNSICGLISGVTETIITNQNNAKNRLTLINKPHYQRTINSMLIPCGIKNCLTYITLFNMRAIFGPILHQKTGISKNNSFALTSAITIMSIQPFMTVLDNTCTIQLSNTHKHPNLNLAEISKNSFQQACKIPLWRSRNIIALRTITMGLSYFIIDRSSNFFVEKSLSFYDNAKTNNNINNNLNNNLDKK
jgi:hypothetical protein